MKIDWNILLRAVEKAEALHPGADRGVEKRAFVIELVASLIPLPFPFSLGKRFVLGLLVDLAVHIFNRIRGKNWVAQIAPSTIKAFQVGGVK